MNQRIKTIIALLSMCCVILSSCGKIDEVSQKVIDDINSIGEVDLSDEQLIEKIESTYATLTDKQKEQVINYADLLKAKDEIDKIYERKKIIKSFESMAALIKNKIQEFLDGRESLGCGLKKNASQIMNITISDSLWTVSAVDPANFEQSGQFNRTWGSIGIGSVNDKDVDVTSNECLLARTLAKSFYGCENGSIKASLARGKVICIAYTSEKSTPLEEGIDCPKIVDGNFDESFEWSEIAGITKEGIIVGTAPVFYGSK